MAKISENSQAKRRKLIAELLKGKGKAAQLQILLHKPAEDHGLASVRELTLQILESLNNSLSELNSESTQISAVDGCDGGDSAYSEAAEEKKMVAVKDRRGCHKRRRSSDSSITISPTTEDGCAWRKYGQKRILNAKYPRCYFRCTYKSQGCKALKQVQKMEENPQLYRITYFNLHTCKDTFVLGPKSFVASDPTEPNLLSFQANVPSKQDYSPNRTNISSISEDFSDAKSSFDPWHDVMGLESFGYDTAWPSSSSRPYQEDNTFAFSSSSSIGLHELDSDANQLSNMDILHFDEP